MPRSVQSFSIAPPPLDKSTLRELLLACTTKCSFTDHEGNLYIQSESVSMGSPLGVTFANFYMCNIENNVMENHPHIKPIIYASYVDDCFVIARDRTAFAQLKDLFQVNSVLSFTEEIGYQNK